MAARKKAKSVKTRRSVSRNKEYFRGFDHVLMMAFSIAALGALIILFFSIIF